VEPGQEDQQPPLRAYDATAAFIQMFSDVVMELPRDKFEEIIDR
jgi:hypothetical protein